MTTIRRVSGPPLSCALMLVLTVTWVGEAGGTRSVTLDAQAFGQHLKTFSDDVMGARRMQVTIRTATIMRKGDGKLLFETCVYSRGNDEANVGCKNGGKES